MMEERSEPVQVGTVWVVTQFDFDADNYSTPRSIIAVAPTLECARDVVLRRISMGRYKHCGIHESSRLLPNGRQQFCVQTVRELDSVDKFLIESVESYDQIIATGPQS